MDSFRKEYATEALISKGPKERDSSLAHTMLSRLAVYVVLLAWILLALYMYAVISEEGSNRAVFGYFLSTEGSGIKFRALVLLAPFALTLIGYLIEERSRLFRKTLVSEVELRRLFEETIIAFANALDAKSPWTMGHSERVANYAVAIADRMGVGADEKQMLWIGSLLHDIGKIGTYDAILDKAAPLTEQEWQLIKMHPGKGADILGPIEHLRPVIPIIRHHHERLDGKGYPDMLKANEIPLLARILCLADSFDAMVAERPYKQAMKREDAIRHIKDKAGTQFDPEIVDVFLEVLGETSERPVYTAAA
jgi:putative nucleotidyltransferase with HDIG domain